MAAAKLAYLRKKREPRLDERETALRRFRQTDFVLLSARPTRPVNRRKDTVKWGGGGRQTRVHGSHQRRGVEKIRADRAPTRTPYSCRPTRTRTRGPSTRSSQPSQMRPQQPNVESRSESRRSFVRRRRRSTTNVAEHFRRRRVNPPPPHPPQKS